MIFPTVIPTNAPSAFVLHVSIAADWGIPARYTVYAHRVQSQLALGVATLVATNWPLDVVDELLAAVRRGETTEQRTDALLTRLSAYRIYLDELAPHRAWPEALDLARTHTISVRDAAYLELALRVHLPLATTDATLLRAATAAAVPIFTP